MGLGHPSLESCPVLVSLPCTVYTDSGVPLHASLTGKVLCERFVLPSGCTLLHTGHLRMVSVPPWRRHSSAEDPCLLELQVRIPAVSDTSGSFICHLCVRC